ncbi:MAG TPA: hypothetical protein VM468_11515, partial [Mycoplana sp.]|nr:hypothetical protein [Mycoplana sp.]
MSSGAAHCDLLCGAPLRQWLCRQFAIQSIANQRDLPEMSRQVLRGQPNRLAARLRLDNHPDRNFAHCDDIS